MAAGQSWHRGCRCRPIPDWVFGGCGGIVGWWVVEVVRIQLAGLFTHLRPGLRVCVCLAPGALAGCALAEPPVWHHYSWSPLDILCTPPLSCSTNCLPSSLLSSTRMVCVPYPTFFPPSSPSHSLLWAPDLFSFISKPDSAWISKAGTLRPKMLLPNILHGYS